MELFIITIFCGVLVSAAAGWVSQLLKRHSRLLLALYPLLIFIQLGFLLPLVKNGQVVILSFPWATQIGLDLSFRLDGLSVLLAGLVSGIGALILIYGGAYLGGNDALAKFYCVILLFMTAMLGIAVSDNALLLFVFWEMTSVTSFLLIGFEHQKASARAAAWQALLVTGAGGLALLAAFVLIGNVSGSYEISQWILQREQLLVHPNIQVALVLIIIGAMTKSAHFPFHFWLPNAMEAPTPVSAYLHSATMVKAGVFLLARLAPLMSASVLWQAVLPWIGLLTLCIGVWLALGQVDLKRLLAYTTIAALGSMTMLLGISTPLAVKATMVLMIAHALYKGALFLVAGGIDHAVHSRDIRELGGLAQTMPLTAAASALAVLSMAGFPPFAGFISKELMIDAGLNARSLPVLFISLVVLANVGMAAIAGWVGLLPFWGKEHQKFHAHEGEWGLWFPPLLLASCGLIFGLLPGWWGEQLIAPAVSVVLSESIKVKLALWHGINLPLLLSLLIIMSAVILYTQRFQLQRFVIPFQERFAGLGPAEIYHRGLKGLISFAALQTRIIQGGFLRVYVLTIVLFTVSIILPLAWDVLRLIPFPSLDKVRFYDVLLAGIIIAAVILVTQSQSRLKTIAILGSIGYSIAILYLLYSAPDLAMVQFAIETLTVVLFVLVLYRLPKFSQLSSHVVKIVDLLIALSGGVLMTVLMLVVSYHGQPSRISNFFMESSLPKAYGRNVVNVILVDFRGFDTLGEITVLSIAAIGVFALIFILKTSLWIKKRKNVEPLRRSLVLPITTRYLMPLLIIFSIFLLLRGHNEVGGGFVGGLVASSALMLYAIAVSPQALYDLLPIKPYGFVGIGLFTALLSGFISVMMGYPFMTGLWMKTEIPVIGKLGTPLLFDVGVYLLVIGVISWIMLTLAEE